MKTGKIAAAIGMVVGGALGVQPLFAQTAPFPTVARSYQAWMARAMDDCSAPTTSVVSPGVPSSGCVAVSSDSSISPGATMSWARLTVKTTRLTTGKVAITGRGFHAGQRMKVDLKLRVTKSAVQTNHPPAFSNVTFEDVEVMCGNNPSTGCFTANLRGSVAGSMTLADCLTQNGEPTGLAQGNIEILDSALVNCDTGDVIGRPGILGQ